jgi:DNA-binding GntR family transcriptional regulator
MSPHETAKEGGEVVGVVVDVVGRIRRRRDMDCPHAKRMGDGKVSRVILEHGGGLGVQTIQREDRGKGLGVGLGVEFSVLDPVDRVKKTAKPPRGKDFFGIGRAGIGVDDLAAGKLCDASGEVGVRRKDREIDVVNLVQVGARIDVMLAHQARKRRAVGLPVIGAQVIGARPVDLKRLHDPVGHLDLDLVEKPHLRRVERVVEVEDPGGDVCEVLLWHGQGCSAGVRPWEGLIARRRAAYGPGRACGDGRRGTWTVQKDAYTLLMEAIEAGVYKPGDRLVESELAERLGVSRTPVREALQRLETQSMLTRDGRSLIVASLDHNQLAELYTVRTELEGLAARLAARHATPEEVRVLKSMVAEDRALLGGDPRALSRANKRFHKQIHLASHNRFLVQQLDLVHRSMALMANTSFAAEGRDEVALVEHAHIVAAIEAGDGDAAYAALKSHISQAFETRLRVEAGELRTR